MSKRQINNHIRDSIDVIKKHQSDNGAYVACPNFNTYNYCWLRDGSFIAYAMDVSGEHASSAAFLSWCNKAIMSMEKSVEELLEALEDGAFVEQSKYPPARFNLDGSLEGSDWPNFQLDGYGTWLWALTQHMELTGKKEIPREYLDSVLLVVKYLKKCWGHECYDCWEEHGDKVHPSTLACIYGGLKAVSPYLNDPSIDNTVDAIRLYITSYCMHDGALVKYMGSDQVDSSLLWLSVPFEVFAPTSSVMEDTVKRIEHDLTHDCGVHRYQKDTYYGGGEWLLLSAWLGWHYTMCGRLDDAILQRDWVESQVDDEGHMTEQVLNHVNKPEKIAEWQALWGQVANPLLWSHAMYLVLANAIESLGKSLR